MLLQCWQLVEGCSRKRSAVSGQRSAYTELKAQSCWREAQATPFDFKLVLSPTHKLKAES
ncbi:MAG: hypothetical protein F6J93_08080 [Oscillatoria sp. SIO1A7]|nr:hypothetical protein [Oscillatoria sp. SIO1A7]